MPLSPADAGQMPTPDSGVRWSGMGDEPSLRPSPEAQAKAQAAYLQALAKMEAEVAAYAASQGRPYIADVATKPALRGAA
jgi:hypothetical protein